MARLAFALATLLFLQAGPPAHVQVVGSADQPNHPVTTLNVVHLKTDAKECPTYAAAHVCGDISHWSITVRAFEYTLETIDDAMKDEATRSTRGSDGKDGVPSLVVSIRSESGAPYEVIRRVVAACSNAGLDSLSFSSEPIESLTRTSDSMRIALLWDASTGSAVRKVDGAMIADDSALERLLAERQARATQHKKASAQVTIDADQHVAWHDVVTIMNICKKVGVKSVEFAFGGGK